MRRLEGSNQPVVVAEPNAGNEAMAVIDKGIEWEKKYEYWITPITSWQQDEKYKGVVEGENSAVMGVVTRDIFPPAVPTGLQAVFSGVSQQAFIDLTWTPNTESDLAGYNVYRRMDGQQAVKISSPSDLVKTPAFRDSAVQPGTIYFYSVSAVDLRKNESARSQETSETVPRQ
jgi:fibronectin type 3 domain-containing protein